MTTETFTFITQKSPSIAKRLNSDLDYGVGLFGWLEDDEAIVDADWAVADGLVAHDDGLSDEDIVIDGVTHPAGTVLVVWLRFDSTAVAGRFYAATCLFTTDSTPPRTDQRTFYLESMD